MAKIGYETMLMHGITMQQRIKLEYAIAFTIGITFACYELFGPPHLSIQNNLIKQNRLPVFNARTAIASLVFRIMGASLVIRTVDASLVVDILVAIQTEPLLHTLL